MDAFAYKLNIINQILLVKDERLLSTIANLLNNGFESGGIAKNHDFWQDLSDEQKEKIAKAIQQIDVGQSVSASEVMSKLRLKYS